MCVVTEPSPQLTELRQYLAQWEVERKAVDFLQGAWKRLNVLLFGGRLKTEPMFLVGDFEGGGRIVGKFSVSEGVPLIYIHAAYFDDAIGAEFEQMTAATMTLAHEMIHQGLWERGSREINSHGAEFVREANRIGKIIGFEGIVSMGGDHRATNWPSSLDEHLQDSERAILREYYRNQK